MIPRALDRATALGRMALAALAACSSHVDVGFTNEGGAAAAASDTRDASSSSQVNAVDAGAVMTAACSLVKLCNDAGRCEPMITYAAWCTEVCMNSIDICDNGECVDLSSDPKNCGRCGHACSSVDTCTMGTCRR